MSEMFQLDGIRFYQVYKIRKVRFGYYFISFDEGRTVFGSGRWGASIWFVR